MGLEQSVTNRAEKLDSIGTNLSFFSLLDSKKNQE